MVATACHVRRMECSYCIYYLGTNYCSNVEKVGMLRQMEDCDDHCLTVLNTFKALHTHASHANRCSS